MLEIIQGYIDFFSLKKFRVLPRTLGGIFDRAVLKKPHLRVAEIATTFLCNSKCVMCSCSEFCDFEKEKNRLQISEYRTLGKHLDELGCISVNVTGGEPLMRKDIEEVIIALNPKNKIINLITNGINLTKERIKRFASIGVDSMVVSLESIDPEENDKIRGYKGHFAAVMNAMRWAKEAKLKFGISLTLGDFNFEKVYEMAKFAKDNRVFLCIAHCGNIGRWADNDLFLSEDNARILLSLIKRNKKMKIDFSANLSLLSGCPAIMEKIYITPYADILPCTFNPISFGNLREESLPLIWQRMVDFHKKNIHSKTLCMRAYDKEYIAKFLRPIKDMEQPVRIEKHPFFHS